MTARLRSLADLVFFFFFFFGLVLLVDQRGGRNPKIRQKVTTERKRSKNKECGESEGKNIG
jgi:hypothetical protein